MWSGIKYQVYLHPVVDSLWSTCKGQLITCVIIQWHSFIHSASKIWWILGMLGARRQYNLDEARVHCMSSNAHTFAPSISKIGSKSSATKSVTERSFYVTMSFILKSNKFKTDIYWHSFRIAIVRCKFLLHKAKTLGDAACSRQNTCLANGRRRGLRYYSNQNNGNQIKISLYQEPL